MTKQELIKKVLDNVDIVLDNNIKDKLLKEEPFMLEERNGVVYETRFRYMLGDNGESGYFQVQLLNLAAPNNTTMYGAVQRVDVVKDDIIALIINGSSGAPFRVLAQPLSSYNGGSLMAIAINRGNISKPNNETNMARVVDKHNKHNNKHISNEDTKSKLEDL